MAEKLQSITFVNEYINSKCDLLIHPRSKFTKMVGAL